MPKFAVHLHGTGCWFGLEERHGRKVVRIEPRPMGFYTVRFVEVVSKEEAAICKVIRQLAKAGHLEAKSRRATDGYHTIKFAPDAAEKLLKTVGDLPVRSNTSISLATLKQ